MKSIVRAISLLLIVSIVIGCASEKPIEKENAVAIDTSIVSVEKSAIALNGEAPDFHEPWMMQEGVTPNQMMPRGEFSSRNMMAPDGGMGFSVPQSEPIEFTVDESDALYEVSTISVSSPDFSETYYDAEDILNIEEYELVPIILKKDSFAASDVPEGVSIKQNGEIIEIENSTNKKFNYYFEGIYEGTIAIKSDNANYAVTLNDATIAGKSFPAMQLKSETKAFFYSAEDSINKISDSADNEKKGAITSSGDVIFSGDGEIELNAYKKHGLKVDGTVRVLSGSLVINCDENAEGNGISADDAFILDGGNVEIYAHGSIQGEESKGIKVNGREGENAKGHLVINGGTITVDSVGKALTAGFESDEDGETATLEDDPTPNVFINNGVIKINTTGAVYEISEDLSLSPEGIEAKNNLVINGGLIEICATDDALNSGGSIIINSGCLFAYSMSADGIDANTSIEINGGLSMILGSSAPEMAIDCDSNSRFAYHGGTVVALSGQGSQTPGSSATTGYVLSTGMQFLNGESIAIVDSEGNALAAFTVPENYTRAFGGIIASSEFKSGEAYTLLRNAEIGGQYFFNGIYLGALTAEGDEAASATISGNTTTIGNAMCGMGAMGGGFDPNMRQNMGGFDPSLMMGPEKRPNSFQWPGN